MQNFINSFMTVNHNYTDRQTPYFMVLKEDYQYHVPVKFSREHLYSQTDNK